MTQAPEFVVRDFCSAWERLNIEEIMGFFADDAVYHNIPVDPVVGVDAIRAMIEMFTTGVERIEFQIKHLSANHDVVLTERIDVFHKADHSISLPVMGIFEIQHGKITAWRDYFDLNQYMQQIQ